MKPDPDAANPAEMPDRALDCAIVTCADSKHASDREFATACKAELRRRHALSIGSVEEQEHRAAIRRSALRHASIAEAA